MRIRNTGALAIVALACLAVTARATAPEEALPPRLRPWEIDEWRHRLTAKGWTRRDFSTALSISKHDRQLFEIYVRLRHKEVPPPAIQESFALCKGDPADVNEYWNWIMKYRFALPEVRAVFSRFPPVSMTRHSYFTYRAGGLEALAERARTAEADRAAPPRGYSAKECMAIFRASRFRTDHVKLYFELRGEGKPPPEAWARVREKILEEIRKRQEEARQKAEEQQQPPEEQTEPETPTGQEPTEDAAPAGDAAPQEDQGEEDILEDEPPMTFEGLEELLGGTPDEDAEEPDAAPEEQTGTDNEEQPESEESEQEHE